MMKHKNQTKKNYPHYYEKGYTFITNIDNEHKNIYIRAIKKYGIFNEKLDAIILDDAYDKFGRINNGNSALLVNKNDSVSDLTDFWSTVDETFKFAYYDQHKQLKQIYQKHTNKLNIMKENLSQHDESWTDADMHKAISEINILASVLGDINKVFEN